MQRLIDPQGAVISSDPWHRLTDKTKMKDYSLISLDDWDDWNDVKSGDEDMFSTHKNFKNIGLQLSGDLTISELLGKLGTEEQAPRTLNKFSLLQIEVAEFKDGRCFSLAMRLRNRIKYTGELRAIGHYLPDQIYFMQRCGFNSFIIDTEMDDEVLRQTLNPFTEVYQRSGDDTSPVTDKNISS